MRKRHNTQANFSPIQWMLWLFAILAVAARRANAIPSAEPIEHDAVLNFQCVMPAQALSWAANQAEKADPAGHLHMMIRPWMINDPYHNPNRYLVLHAENIDGTSYGGVKQYIDSTAAPSATELFSISLVNSTPDSCSDICCPQKPTLQFNIEREGQAIASQLKEALSSLVESSTPTSTEINHTEDGTLKVIFPTGNIDAAKQLISKLETTKLKDIIDRGDYRSERPLLSRRYGQTLRCRLDDIHDNHAPLPSSDIPRITSWYS